MKKLLLTITLLGSIVCIANAQSFVQPNNNPQFNPYVPQVDVNLYRDVITEKQRNYDKNYNSNYEDIQELIDDLADYVQELYELNPERGKIFHSTIESYIRSISESKIDLSDNNISSKIKRDLKEYIKYTKNAIKEEY